MFAPGSIVAICAAGDQSEREMRYWTETYHGVNNQFMGLPIKLEVPIVEVAECGGKRRLPGTHIDLSVEYESANGISKRTDVLADGNCSERSGGHIRVG
jgi:hypothetical protein